MTIPVESWTSGDSYEAYVGRWSRLVAVQFLSWLNLPAGGRWLDVGCGSGALSQTILETQSPAHVMGIDRSPHYVEFARQHTRDRRAEFAVGDAQALQVEPGTCDAAVSALVLNFLAQPGLAAAGMRRALRPGGVAAAYVWDYAGQVQFMRYFWDAAAALAPAARAIDEGRRFPLCQPGPLQQLFEAAGLQRVEVRPIDIPTRFRDFDDYWSPFLGGQGPTPGYLVSLNEPERVALRERVRLSLPIAPDGSILLQARAWAVRGSA